jgi:hypothetical protein
MTKSKENQTQAKASEKTANAPAPEAPAPALKETPAPAPEESEAPGLKLYTLEEMAEANRVPSWQGAALHKLMGWEPGKRVSLGEYKAGLARLKNRRIGG